MKAAVSKRWLDSSAVVAGKPSPEALGKEKAASYKPRPVPQTVQYDTNKPGPSGVDLINIVESTDDTTEEVELPEKYERPRGFELVSKYRPSVNLDEDASVYCLMDLNLLKGFLADLPCKFCLDTHTNITYSYLSSFVVQVQIQCFSCNNSMSIKTSKCINDESTNRNFSDINRRMVRTFSSIGKKVIWPWKNFVWE